MSKLRVKQIRGLIGRPGDQRATVRALGLRRIGHSVLHDDTPSLRGMLFKVRHLIEVEAEEGQQ
jgi:large subunit ribosomal protein L30